MSELSDLRRRLHEKWMEKEHERAATDLHDFKGVFLAVDALIDQCLRATLSYLGHESGPDEAAAQMANKLRDIVASQPSAVPAEADLDFYLRLMDVLVLDAEAIDHFRSNYSGDWAEQYQGVLPNKVGWGATNAFRSLFDAFEGQTVRKTEPSVPRNAFPKVSDRVARALRSDGDPAEFMRRVVGACRELVPSEAWASYESLEYADEVVALRPFLTEAPEASPPEDVNCFWFSIEYPVRGDETVADADVSDRLTTIPARISGSKSPPPTTAG